MKNMSSLVITKIASFQDYINYVNKNREKHIANLRFQKELIPDTPQEFSYHGYCYVCKTFVDFMVDFNYAHEVDGVLMPNWRERLVCPICNLNNRMRSVVHVFDLEFHPPKNSNIYITEQTTALYNILKQLFPNIYGSEYLGDKIDYGSCDCNGIRNEDITQLSFPDDQFDFILSFDVFEHIPNYKKALSECYRCLKKGGILLFSVPFIRDYERNLVRAYQSFTGKVVHLLPPEYHGDPINSDGCLCYYHFGWELFEDLKTAGFDNPQALICWSKEYGYLGDEQIMFTARKR